MTEALKPYFANMNAWPWLAAVPIVCAVMIYGLAMKRRALQAFASDGLLAFLAPQMSRWRPIVRILLVSSAALAIGAAFVGPRWGVYFEEAHNRRLDLMICLDVSRSMLAEDAGMSRLDRAKDDIRRLLDRIGGASVGLVAFAGKADFTCPLTDDYEYFRLVLEDVDPLTAPAGGTNIGEALAAARRAFGPAAGAERAIIVMTDGEDHGGTAIDEARAALESGIKVYAIGIGTDDPGSLIPIEKDGQRSYLRYRDQQVWTRLDPASLQKIAQAGGGEYHPTGQVNNQERTLEWIYSRKLKPLVQQGEAEQQIERRHDRAHWFASAALALLMIDSLMRESRGRAASNERLVRA